VPVARGLAVAALLASVALPGCASLAPPTPTTTTTSWPSKIARAEATHEYRSSPPGRQRADATALTPIHAITAFATAYTNWSAATVTADLRALAAASIGQARAAMELAAAGAARDYELRRGGIDNSGTVEAVARLVGSDDQYAVVTRELTTATNTAAYQGLRPAWHLTLATVTEVQSGAWVVSGWQPEN
jgi:hypothetical protein